jgi:hypothetical protein
MRAPAAPSDGDEAGPAEDKLAQALTKWLLPAEAAAVRIASKSGWTYAGRSVYGLIGLATASRYNANIGRRPA